MLLMIVVYFHVQQIAAVRLHVVN